MKRRAIFGCLVLVTLIVGGVYVIGPAGASPGFSTTVLSRPIGDSEPAISIGADGTMAITGLPWNRTTIQDFATDLWTGPFGSVPAFRGGFDASLLQPGRLVAGAEDADVDLGSTGTLHATSLVALVTRPLTAATLGVSAISCPGGDTSNKFANCTRQIIDKAGADRQWITSDANQVWISYHDAGNSSLIHVQRSDDDGLTWHNVGDPIRGQGPTTGKATFNNSQGPIVADPFTHNVYVVYAAGEPGLQKGTSADFNNIFVSRSTNDGATWHAVLVHHEPVFTRLNQVFPALAVDSTNGALYAVWTDLTKVFVSRSSDKGLTWSAPLAVSGNPANTTVMPWVGARGGKVDIVYYGTSAPSKDDPTAVWNVYLAESTDGGASYAQTQISPTPNHVGVICTDGSGCPDQNVTRTLLDLFEVAIDPVSGKTAIVYVDDTLATFTSDSDTFQLPQLVLAQEA